METHTRRVRRGGGPRPVGANDVPGRAACGDDLDLRREVESLLAHDGPSHQTIERLVVEAAVDAAGRQNPPELDVVPTSIGRYRILATLGEGGMVKSSWRRTPAWAVESR